MGLFSKKEYVCRRCGKTFTARLEPVDMLCNDCWDLEEKEREELEKACSGYVRYAKKVLDKKYTVDELREIVAHRQEILDRNINENGISIPALLDAGKNYKKLSDEEAQEILSRLSNATPVGVLGITVCGNMFVLSEYEGVVVDADDVFAVATANKENGTLKDGTRAEILNCQVLTNDPYMPSFQFNWLGELKFLEIRKSKNAREEIAAVVGGLCPNLTYPVSEAKELKKQLKAADSVQGSMDKKFALQQLDGATYDFHDVSKEVSMLSRELMSNCGYVSLEDAAALLRMNEFGPGRFWNKQITKLTKRVLEQSK